MIIGSVGPANATIRLLPGIYVDPIVISSGTMTFVGAGAVLRAASEELNPLEVRGAANVRVHRLEIDSANSTSLVLAGVRCEGAGTSFPTLNLKDSTIHVFISVKHASLAVQDSVLGYDVAALEDGTAVLDRTYFRQTRGFRGNIGGRSSKHRVQITNSILQDVNITFDTISTIPGNTSLYIGLSTFAGGTPLRCPASSSPTLAIFENNIFVSTSSTAPPISWEPGSNCAFISNLIYPRVPDIEGGNIGDAPQLVDLASGDYRLQPSSPAIDRATSVAGPNFDHDFAGTPRPIGTRSDLGAFEFNP